MLGALIDDEVKELVNGYRETGYLVLRNAFDGYEVEAWQAECDRLGKETTIVNPENIRTPFKHGSTVNPERIDPVIDISPVFKSLANDRRITNVVREIFDTPPRFEELRRMLLAEWKAGPERWGTWAREVFEELGLDEDADGWRPLVEAQAFLGALRETFAAEAA